MTTPTKPNVAPPVAFPIVGIGASAGGLAAFAAFFSGMPAMREPGMAFVLVQHLAPDHSSLLTELVQRTTRMPVIEVTDGMAVNVNCVYIIPPNRDMAFLNGALQLLEPSAPRGHRLPIDFLFSSLAQDQQERVTDAMEAAGACASAERPLAWIALEANRTVHLHELVVRHWPNAADDPAGDPQLLARAHPHGASVNWFA